MQLLRPMLASDVDAAVDVIESHDEDDAIDARESYSGTSGLDDQFVIEDGNGRIVGVTGYSTPPGCDQTHWLSWTYIHSDAVNQGLGRKIINELIEHLQQAGARKLFVKVSDYSEVDDSGKQVSLYAAALHLYQSLGFSEEIVLKDYYDDGESMTILGLRVADTPNAAAANPSTQWESHKLQFNAIFEIAETDDAYSFGWAPGAKRLFDVSDATLGLEDVKKRDGRAVFLSFPHNYAKIADTLGAAGFANAGVLQDYFEDGVHEQHFSYYF